MSLQQLLHDQLQTNFTAGARHPDENRLILKSMEIWKSKKKKKRKLLGLPPRQFQSANMNII